MTEEDFRCVFDLTSKGSYVHEADKSTCNNVFSNEGLERSVNGVDGTCCETLDMAINESGDADLMTGA